MGGTVTILVPGIGVYAERKLFYSFEGGYGNFTTRMLFSSSLKLRVSCCGIIAPGRVDNWVWCGGGFDPIVNAARLGLSW